jgi:CBS domain-containing protein
MTQTATQQPAQPPPDLVTVADVMRPPLTTADTNDHVAAAAYLMKHARATALTVLDTQTGQPKGILTKADIAHAVADGKDLNDLRIRELMTTRPAIINPAASIRDAAQIMIRGHFRHLPVCGDSGLVGIIDITDIRRALIDPDVSWRPTADAALRPDGLTPATNEPPPDRGTSPAVQPPPGDDDRNPAGEPHGGARTTPGNGPHTERVIECCPAGRHPAHGHAVVRVSGRWRGLLRVLGDAAVCAGPSASGASRRPEWLRGITSGVGWPQTGLVGLIKGRR